MARPQPAWRSRKRWDAASQALAAIRELWPLPSGAIPIAGSPLQDLGQCRIEQDADLFCREVLAAGGFVPGNDFVLDGIRHVEVLPHLARIAAPSEMRLIFLKADAAPRSMRARERSAKEAKDFNRAARHVVEADTEERLPMEAHAIVDSSLSGPVVIERCIELIEIWRWTGAGITPKSEIRAAVGRTQRT